MFKQTGSAKPAVSFALCPLSAASYRKPRIPFAEEIGLELDDSFATMVRKCIYKRIHGSKQKKEAALEDVWLDINSMVGDFKDRSPFLGDAVNEVNSKVLNDITKPGDPLGKKYPHAPQYEWKKYKSKGGNYVWQCPNKAEVLLSCIALHLKPEEALEVYGDRRAAVCLELTKQFQRVKRGRLSELAPQFDEKAKGEAVIVIEGK